jgi:glycosyltransferase involved in cell wall biosynthesis/2-polyprenyl-3-methyl-5-hydroxy-6-metoxy-1,4-benzoquinol methylase
MYTIIYASGMSFNGNTLKNGDSLGGSESAAYYMGKELAALGHEVTMFTASREGGKVDGVTYEWHGNITKGNPLGERFEAYAQTVPHDNLIIQRHPFGFAKRYLSKVNIWWLHDLALRRSKSMVMNHMWNIDYIFTVSDWHKKQVERIYDIEPDNVINTRNGIDMELYPKDKVLGYHGREPKTLLYSARPERGLVNLIGEGGVMEELTDYHLYVCGYDNTTEQMRPLYDYLNERCKELPNVTNLGYLSKKELSDMQHKVMAYAYATEFEETSCITAMESMASGTPFIASSCGALPETLSDGGAYFVHLKSGKVNKEKFIASVRKVCENEDVWNKRHNLAIKYDNSWGNVAKEWDVAIKERLADASLYKDRLHRHLERHSDIAAAVSDGATDSTIPGLSENYDFFFSGDIAKHYADYYEREEDVKGVIHKPQSHRGDPRFEATLSEVTHIRATKEGKLRILDYGCAHGHYTHNLASVIHNSDFVGMDISERNITQTKVWTEEFKDRLAEDSTVSFKHGQHTDIEGKFDVIIMEEVMEHLIDPMEVLNALRDHLSDTGRIIVSTPYGAWESLGYEAEKGWRAHLHHFERTDLHEMFGEQTDIHFMAIPAPEFGYGMGYYLISFAPKEGVPFGTVDYKRKIVEQAPRQTISLCMIVKDGEDELGRTLNSCKSVVDEIIIGIDEGTTDDTLKVAERFGAKTFPIKSPIEQGFDSARNEVIAKAKMDWVLWVDADETLEQTENLEKYLRHNQFTAYAINQHHYAVEPAAKFQTDYPARLFRNGRGVKFFGRVHEHPELELNEGIGKVMLIPDVAIMHNGYSTEPIRRERFKRNFPLIQRDRKDYPDRTLGKFLWVRDLGHVIRYELEGNGNTITPYIEAVAKEIISLWRELLTKDKNLRMVNDCIQYYSLAVECLGGGLDYRIISNASRANGGVKLDDVPALGGKFASKEDIDSWTDLIKHEQFAEITGDYF